MRGVPARWSAHARGVRLAVDQFNSAASEEFLLDLVVHDDGGEPERARAVAGRLSADERVLAVLGPSDDTCAAAAVDRYQQALLAMVSVSLGRPLARTVGTHRVFVATRPRDDPLAAPLVAHLSRTVRTRHTMLLADAALGDAGWFLCRHTAEALGGKVRTGLRTVAGGGGPGGWGAVAGQVVASGADAVVFAGGTEPAARLARALGSAGSPAPGWARTTPWRPGSSTSPGTRRGAGSSPRPSWTRGGRSPPRRSPPRTGSASRAPTRPGTRPRRTTRRCSSYGPSPNWVRPARTGRSRAAVAQDPLRGHHQGAALRPRGRGPQHRRAVPLPGGQGRLRLPGQGAGAGAESGPGDEQLGVRGAVSGPGAGRRGRRAPGRPLGAPPGNRGGPGRSEALLAHGVRSVVPVTASR